LSALVSFAAAVDEFTDGVGEILAGVIAEFAFEPPEHADGDGGDDGDHE
jgi:hypothetical protein